MPNRPHNFRALSKPKQLHKKEHRHYWPYIPVSLLVIATVLASTLQPMQHKGVLAYATNMSIDQLLSATNQQREQNSAGDIQLSGNLNNAAQAKANDMVARNYWSHNTPDGQEPWVFINNAGYKYLKAGENLAYGFTTSNDAVTGWMNSPSHRENLLDTGFTQVGFGFANGADYNKSGPETVVVAMYGKPQVLGASNQTAGAEPAKPVSAEQPVTTAQPIVTEPATKQVARVQTLTGGKAPWTQFVVGLVVGLSLMLLLVKHAAGIRHLFKNTERFVLHHPLLDTILMSLVFAGTLLSKTTGFIR